MNMQLSLPATQKILEHSSTKHHEISGSFVKQIKKRKGTKKNLAVSRLGNFGVEDDNSWEKRVFFE
jgi:hypothetical protein